MIKRELTSKIITALKDTPAVLLHGARQTGKSTLIKWISENIHPAQYINLDELTMLSAAKNDPLGFIEGFNTNLAIDEIQKVPELFLIIKSSIDKSRKPGMFILTGSANIFTLSKISESLAGRIEILKLYPFSQSEIEENKNNFLDTLISGNFGKVILNGSDKPIENRICTGGYPEMQVRNGYSRQRAWFDSYITAILQKDIRDISNIEAVRDLPQILSLLAARTGSLMNYAELSRSLSIPQTTLKRYIALLKSVFFIHELPAWSGNLGKRLIKTPKIYLNDTGLLTHLLGKNKNNVNENDSYYGNIIENFVFTELIKLISWHKLTIRLYHYRTHSGQEIDFLLELEDGKVIPIEVKASKQVTAKMFNSISTFSGELKNKYLRGIILYQGNEIVPFGNNMFAVPINRLWS